MIEVTLNLIGYLRFVGSLQLALVLQNAHFCE
jgi:hypothetical protein